MIGTMNQKKITILAFQQSVIVRGIEKRITEMKHEVEVLSEKDQLERIDLYTGSTDLFIFYLPDKVKEDALKLKTVLLVCNTVYEASAEMILIGEKDDKSDLAGEIQNFSHFTWIDRPVDMENLTKIVDSKLSIAEMPKAGENSEKPAKKILLVDDDPLYAKMVREWIKDYYSVSVVTAGMQAITFLMKNKADLILLDYEMPVVDGPQVFQMLKSEPETADIPIVFLTGVGDRENVQKVLALHPTGYILKSTSRDDLLKYIKSVLEVDKNNNIHSTRSMA